MHVGRPSDAADMDILARSGPRCMLGRARRLGGARVIYVSVEATVKRRPEVVWDVLSDVASATAWIEGLVAVEPDDDDARPGVGYTMNVVRRDGARSVAASSEITAWRERSLLAIETRAGGMLFFDRVTLAPVDAASTRLGVYGEIVFGSRIAELFARPHGLLGAVADPWTERVQAVYQRSVDALVKRIESTSERPYR